MDTLTRRYLAIVSIFEGGKPFRYATLSCSKGDAGGLSLGYLQASITSGNAGKLLRLYYASGGRCIPESYVKRAEAVDNTLGDAPEFRAMWKAAATDPIMQRAQDNFFAKEFLEPAMAAAAKLGITEPLGICVVFDGFIQGAFAKIAKRVPPGLNQWDWVRQYVAIRRDWLATHPTRPILHETVYRMDFFLEQLEALGGSGNWKLDTPFICHGVGVA